MTDSRATRAVAAPEPVVLSRGACGTCKALWLTNKPPVHSGCRMRAVLAFAPDHPDDEALADMSEQQRAELPARFHVPVFNDLIKPQSWLCAVCGNEDGLVHSWPCATAVQHGREVFER